ncbi:MAG TPA: SDR family oxidoreductase [Solirubrobacterales bacterium]
MPLPPPASDGAALVTGASSGIGAEIARLLAARGHNLVLVARRAERLRALADELSGAHGVRAEPLPADLQDPAARARLADDVGELGLVVEVLVNNAGFGGSGSLHRTDPARVAEMVRLNCEAVVELQARLSPGMVERRRGAIINLASAAAFQPMPGNAAYAATKAFVLSLSEATHAELAPHGVTVTAVCPGPVRTEFVEAAGIKVGERVPEFIWTDVEAVARAAVEGAEKGKRVVVPGMLYRVGALAGHYTPRALALPIVGRVWRLGA